MRLARRGDCDERELRAGFEKRKKTGDHAHHRTGPGAQGLAVYPYTVDAEDDMRRLLDLGVDGLFTNYPDRLRALIDFPVGDLA